MARIAIALTAACALGLASAAHAAEDDAPVPATSLTTVEQIDAFLRASPTQALPDDGVDGVTERPAPRAAHGAVAVSVGTGGYRSVYARTDLPLGKSGLLSIAVQQSQGDGWRGDRGFVDGGPLNGGWGVWNEDVQRVRPSGRGGRRR